jgi:hypothetical protein
MQYDNLDATEHSELIVSIIVSIIVFLSIFLAG